MIFEDTVWFSIFALLSTQSFALITSFDVINFLIVIFFKALFSFPIFSVTRSKVHWYGVGSVSLAAMCRALTDESGSLNVFVGIHLKAIQIAVSYFLFQELEGIHAHSHPFCIHS